MRKIILCILIASIWPVIVQAMDIEFEPIPGNHALSNGAIFVIFQDSRDFIWIGTNSGLLKYDGNRFTVYKKNDRIENSLSSDRINCICEDQSGVLWLGSDTSGLNRFDPKTETFTRFVHNPVDPNSISNNQIICVFVDRKGTLWIGTNNGLNKMNSKVGDFTHYLVDSKNPYSISHKEINAICEDQKGNLWIGTKAGLNYLDIPGDRFVHFFNEPMKPTGTIPYISGIIPVSPNTLWISTLNHGLIKFNSNLKTTTNYRHDSNNPNSLVSNEIYSILLDHNGLIWAATSILGFCTLNPETGQFLHYRNEPDNPKSLCNDVVLNFFEDRTGIIWIGTLAGGGNKVDRRKKKFSTYSHNPNHTNCLNDNLVFCLYEDKNSILWIGYASKGMSKLNRKTGQFTHYRAQQGVPDCLQGDVIPCITGDDSGQLWIGTQGEGLHKFDPLTEKFKSYKNTSKNSYLRGQDWIRALVLDGTDLYIGTIGLGIAVFDIPTETFTHFQHNPDNPNSISNNLISALFKDSTGTIWVGTWGGGLNTFNKEQKTFTRYCVEADNLNSINDNEIHCIYEDLSGIIWIGTGGGGLNRFDRSTNKFFHLTSEDGLPDNFINGILEDKRGNLWFSSNRGISRFNPKTKSIKNYSLRDGLQSYKFNFGSYLKTKKGEMFFGGIYGLNYFNPEQIQDNPNIPRVVITDFKRFNRSVPIGEGSFLEHDISCTDQLSLSYKDNFFSLEFAALDYSNPTQNQYKYKLDGLHNDWIYLGNKNEVNFTGLPPGRYVLRVKGSNNDGLWNETGTQLKIIINPPFWASWWFRILVIIGISGILILWHKNRMNRLTLKLRTETEMERFFSRFKLSKRELEIVQMVIKGNSNKDIEDQLYISLPTVKSHIHNIYKKLGVKNRLELINFTQKGIPSFVHKELIHEFN